jgi:hypothetical protein
MKHENHIHIYRYEINQEEHQTINTNVIMEFNNLAYVSGPLSQWVRLSYFYSKIYKYITTVSKSLQTDLALFY